MTAAWLDLVADLLPPGYIENCAAEESAAAEVAARHAVLNGQIGRAETALRAALSQRCRDDPAAAVPLASDLLALKSLVAFLPTPAAAHGMSLDMARGIDSRLPRPWSRLELGPPPMFAREHIHSVQKHEGRLVIFGSDAEQTALGAYEQLHVLASKFVVGSAASISEPLADPDEIEGRVREWHGISTSQEWDLLREAIPALEAHIAELNAERVASGNAHRCPRQGGQPLDGGPRWRVTGRPWVLEQQMVQSSQGEILPPTRMAGVS